MKLIYTLAFSAIVFVVCPTFAQESTEVNDPLAEASAEPRDPTVPIPEIKEKLEPKEVLPPQVPTPQTSTQPVVLPTLAASKLRVLGLVMYPDQSATISIGLADTAIRMQLDSSIYAERMKIAKSDLLRRPPSIESDADVSEEISLDYVFQLDTTYRVVSFNRQQVLVQRIIDNQYFLLRPQSNQAVSQTPSFNNSN